MNIIMTREQFIERATVFVNRVFKGICEHPFQIGVNQLPHVIRFIGKVNETDFEAIKYSDVYPSAQKIITRMGAIRRDPDGHPFNSELKLFDPYFESLEYKEIEEEQEIWTE